MAHFKAFLGSHQDLGPETAVPVLGTRPRPRSELKTLDTLLVGHLIGRGILVDALLVLALLVLQQFLLLLNLK